MKIRITGCDIDVKQKKTDIIDIANGKREFSLYFFKNPVLIKTPNGSLLCFVAATPPGNVFHCWVSSGSSKAGIWEFVRCRHCLKNMSRGPQRMHTQQLNISKKKLCLAQSS